MRITFRVEGDLEIANESHALATMSKLRSCIGGMCLEHLHNAISDKVVVLEIKTKLTMERATDDPAWTAP